MQSTDNNRVRDINFFAQNAAIGQFISVEIANSTRDNLKTHLVGCKAGSYLILEMPSLIEAGDIKRSLVVDKPLIIRTICEKTTGECMGFHSAVQGIVRVPYPVFFAAYPNEVETRELRTERRMQTAIPCQMFKQDGGEKMPGLITDLSAGGCRFELHVREEVVKIKARNMYLRFVDPAVGQEVTKLVEVCSQRKTGTLMSIGFSFTREMRATA